jgi:hypothetical protein
VFCNVLRTHVAVGPVRAALYGEISGLIRAGLEHVQLAGARFQLRESRTYTGHFLDVWPHSASTSCPMCKYVSSIDPACRGPLSSSSTARHDWVPLRCDAKHTRRLRAEITELQSVRRKTSQGLVVKKNARGSTVSKRHRISPITGQERPPFSGAPCIIAAICPGAPCSRVCIAAIAPKKAHVRTCARAGGILPNQLITDDRPHAPLESHNPVSAGLWGSATGR